MNSSGLNSIEPLWFVVAALAVYRVSHMVAQEEGPFEVWARLRSALGGDHQATWVGRGINCVLCVSFWLGWLGALALASGLVVAHFILLALALSGAVLVFKKALRA